MIIAALAVAVTLGAGPSIVGSWLTPVDEGVIRIEPCGASMCGHVQSSTPLRVEPDKRDARNHDPSLRSRPIKELLVLELRPLGPGRWGDGWIYDPRNGGTFKASAEVKPDGRLLLTGCLVAPLCQTQAWTRAR